MLPDLPSFAERRPPSFHDVRTALSVLRGRSRLIRSRLTRTQRPNQKAVIGTLDEIELQIDEICRQLDVLEHTAFGSPYQ